MGFSYRVFAPQGENCRNFKNLHQFPCVEPVCLSIFQVKSSTQHIKLQLHHAFKRKLERGNEARLTFIHRLSLQLPCQSISVTCWRGFPFRGEHVHLPPHYHIGVRLLIFLLGPQQCSNLDCFFRHCFSSKLIHFTTLLMASF